jgi:hypothetical protein
MKNPKYKIINICQSLPIIIVILFGFISIVATGGGDGTGVILTNENHDIEPFIEYAEASDCTDIRNRLFIIDDELVLWDRAGSCPDNSYEVQLFRESLDDLLCETYDSIAGPQTYIYDEDYRDLFEVILDNIEDENLDLGDDHLVEEVFF